MDAVLPESVSFIFMRHTALWERIYGECGKDYGGEECVEWYVSQEGESGKAWVSNLVVFSG